MAQRMTSNQLFAKRILGYVPEGYVCVTHDCNTGFGFEIGSIYVDGRRLCSFRIIDSDFDFNSTKATKCKK